MVPFPQYKPGFLSEISIIEIGAEKWKDRVYQKLGGHLKRPRILESVLDLVQGNNLNGKTVLIEPYISTDWADEYQTWYSRTFRDVSRRAIRLHFFSGIGTNKRVLQEGDLFNLPSECTRASKSPYLGYCVVRPFEPITVADTVLKSPYVKDESNSVRCTLRSEAHILGHLLHVTGMPFIQQDRAVSVCAQANLWMVAKYMHGRGEARRFRPSEMDRIATSSIGYGATRDGLFDYQMFNALRLMDIKSDLIAPENAEDAIRLIYAYVSSEIPVIVAIPGHVFTVIGYTYSAKQNGLLRKHDSMAGYVDSFIVHDDARGPYLQLPVGRGSKKKLTIGGHPVGSCLIPMPSGRINLRESDVRNFLANWISKLKLLKSTEGKTRKDTIWTENDFTDLVHRIYLRRNDQFKRDIYPSRDDTRRDSKKLSWRAPDTVALYWRQMLPLYVWVVEFSQRHSVENNGPYGRQLIGEMLLDSTGHADDFFNSLLVVHFRGRMIFRENPPGSQLIEGDVGDRREFNFIDQLDTAEYSPLYRHYS